MIKLGTAINIPQRERQLRAERHAGYGDWIVLFSVSVNEAGRVEHEASARVEGRRVFKNYFKDGYSQTAIEVLECSFSAALRAITETIGSLDSHDTQSYPSYIHTERQ